RRQKGEKHADDKTCCLPLREHRPCEAQKPAEIDGKQRQYGTELDQDRKRFPESIVSPTQQVLHQQEVTGGRNREIFGQTLDDTEYGRLDKVEMHERLRSFADDYKGEETGQRFWPKAG